MAGNIKKMSFLKEQSPTNIAKFLGIQYNSYLDKLDHPEKFYVKHIYMLAKACELDPKIIFDVIGKEVEERISEELDS